MKSFFVEAGSWIEVGPRPREPRTLNRGWFNAEVKTPFQRVSIQLSLPALNTLRTNTVLDCSNPESAKNTHEGGNYAQTETTA